jgi:hypothetical protein
MPLPMLLLLLLLIEDVDRNATSSAPMKNSKIIAIFFRSSVIVI